MQDVLYQSLVEILRTLEAVTAELHAIHQDTVVKDIRSKGCPAESCQALGAARAQVEDLRRVLGVASFRTR